MTNISIEMWSLQKNYAVDKKNGLSAPGADTGVPVYEIWDQNMHHFWLYPI